MTGYTIGAGKQTGYFCFILNRGQTTASSYVFVYLAASFSCISLFLAEGQCPPYILLYFWGDLIIDYWEWLGVGRAVTYPAKDQSNPSLAFWGKSGTNQRVIKKW